MDAEEIQEGETPELPAVQQTSAPSIAAGSAASDSGGGGDSDGGRRSGSSFGDDDNDARDSLRRLLQRAGSHTPEMVSLDAETMLSLREKGYHVFREKGDKGRYRALTHDRLEELAPTNHLVIFDASGELSRLVLAPTPARSFKYLRDAEFQGLNPTINLKDSRSEFSAGTPEHVEAKNEQRAFCAREAKARRAAARGLAIYLEGQDATSTSMLLEGEGAFEPREVRGPAQLAAAWPATF